MSIKQKNIALFLVFMLTLVISYKFAINNTLMERQKLSSLYKEKILFKNAPKQLSLLQQREEYYNSILTKHQLNGSSLQNSLLKTINIFANTNNLKVVSFLEPHTIHKNELSIKTYEFVIEGNYNSIINLVYQLEQETKFGEIINLHFERKKNFRTNNNYLQIKVLLRSFG